MCAGSILGPRDPALNKTSNIPDLRSLLEDDTINKQTDKAIIIKYLT